MKVSIQKSVAGSTPMWMKQLEADKCVSDHLWCWAPTSHGSYATATGVCEEVWRNERWRPNCFPRAAFEVLSLITVLCLRL